MDRFEAIPAECGVTDAPLASWEKETLDRQGYLLIPLAAAWLERLRAALEAVLTRPGEAADTRQSGTGTTR